MNRNRVWVFGLVFGIVVGGLAMMSCGDGAGGPSDNPTQSNPGGNTGGNQNNPGGSGNNQGGNQSQTGNANIVITGVTRPINEFRIQVGVVGGTSLSAPQSRHVPDGQSQTGLAGFPGRQRDVPHYIVLTSVEPPHIEIGRVTRDNIVGNITIPFTDFILQP